MIPSWLSLMDVGCITATLLFALSGFQSGFTKQVAHVITFLIFGIVLFFVYPALFDYFAKLYYNMNPISLMWIILLGAAVLAICVFILVRRVMVKYLKSKLAVWFDKTFGLILGLLRGACLALLIMILVAMVGTTGMYNAINSKSLVGQWVCEELIPVIQPEIKRVSLEAKVNKLRDRLLERTDSDLSE